MVESLLEDGNMVSLLLNSASNVRIALHFDDVSERQSVNKKFTIGNNSNAPCAGKRQDGGNEDQGRLLGARNTMLIFEHRSH